MSSFSKTISNRLADFESHFSAAISGVALDTAMQEAISYAALGGGKRIRPFCLLSLGASLGVPKEQLVPAAIAVEMIHAYSLVHDDLPAMDDDDLRRGRPTVHIAFDEATAILAGDALLTEAFAVLATTSQVAPDHRLALVTLLAQKSGARGMVAGQGRDLAAEGKTDLSLAELAAIQHLKTGAIFEYCTVAPAILADCTQGQQQAMQDFGQVLGELFQLSDDVIGATVSAEISGKSGDSDQANDKVNFVRLYGVEKARQECQNLARRGKDCLYQAGISSPEMEQLLDGIAIRER